MNRKLPVSLLATAVAALMGAPQAGAFTPVKPGNLKAEVNGVAVTLTWEWGNAGAAVCSESFEGDSFEGKWSTRNTYAYPDAETGNWMIYEAGDDEDFLIHDGAKGAVLLPSFDGDEDNPSTFHQDEWLIARPGAGAVYLDFWYFIHPELLDVGGYESFPDHHYVMISRDGGETWGELWDARWDMTGEDVARQASLFLGEPTDDNTLVAFRGVSGEEESLYFTWVIDDVKFLSASEAANAAMKVTASADRGVRPHAATAASLSLGRTFSPRAGEHKSARRQAPPIIEPGEDEFVDNGNTTYRVYLDGELIASFLKRHSFTDLTNKPGGEHTYEVLAWSEAEDKEYEAASVTVTTQEAVFNPARNLRTFMSPQTGGLYTIEAEWDAPEGEMAPDHYNVFVNGKQIGRVDAGEDLHLGQTGLYKGYYTFAVQAEYVFPDGSSEMITKSVAAGTTGAPENLTIHTSGSSVSLTWRAPDCGEEAPASYNVYRGHTLVGRRINALSFTDTDVPDGTYEYSVHAVYGDNNFSLPAVGQSIVGDSEAVLRAMPCVESFDTPHLGDGWTRELVDPYDRIKDMYIWRFDNWFDIAIPDGLGFSGNFASINGVIAGMNRIESYLTSPVYAVDGDTDYIVAFDKYFSEDVPGPSGEALFSLQMSVDQGVTWEEIANLRELPDGHVSLPLALDKADTSVSLRWAFLARKSGIAAIDNIVIGDPSALKPVIADNDTVDIYSVWGYKVATGVSASTVDSLPSGCYVVRAADGRTAKRIVK